MKISHWLSGGCEHSFRRRIFNQLEKEGCSIPKNDNALQLIMLLRRGWVDFAAYPEFDGEWVIILGSGLVPTINFLPSLIRFSTTPWLIGTVKIDRSHQSSYFDLNVNPHTCVLPEDITIHIINNINDYFIKFLKEHPSISLCH